MGFDNTRFPDDIGYGSRAGPGFKTAVIELASGAEERISRWEIPRHRYDVQYGIRTYDDLLFVKQFFMARKGALQSFLFKDWQDHATNAEAKTYDVFTALSGEDQPLMRVGDGVLGVGDGSETTYQMVREYPDTIQEHVRTITKPVSGTALINVNGASAGTEGTDYVITYSTGIVEFTTAPPIGQTVRWGGEYDVETRFDEATDEWLSMTFDDFSSGSSPVVLVELTDSVQVPDRFNHGGVMPHGNQTGTTVDIVQIDGRVHTINPQDANVVARIQRVDDLPPGDNHFHIVNLSGTFTIAVETQDTTSLLTLPVNGICEILVTDDGTGAKTLIAFD